MNKLILKIYVIYQLKKMEIFDWIERKARRYM